MMNTSSQNNIVPGETSQEDVFSFPDPQVKESRARRVQRSLEIIPGILTWFTIIGMIVFSFFLPAAVAVFIIAFDIYWIHRTVFVAFYSVNAFGKLRAGQKIDWWERCRRVSDPDDLAQEIAQQIVDLRTQLHTSGKPRKERKLIKRSITERKAFLREVQQLKEVSVLDWRDIIHVILLPTATEHAENILPSIQAIKESKYPNENVIILLAAEEREAEGPRKKKIKILKDQFDGVFRDFLVTEHIVADGEMKCKASNATFAAKELKKYLEERKIDRKRVILSNFDCESVAHPQYLAALTYAYITDPKRLQRAYQPIPLYHNNLWDTNAFVRVIVTSSSFWHMFQSTRKEMVTFSSHAEPFDTIVKVNYWPVNMISEDSIIFWKGFSRFSGDYYVKPLYLPVSMDAVLAETYWKTITNQYQQKRRWAYGIENFPVIMRAISPNKKITFRRKSYVAFEMLEGHWSWATAPLILAVLGWLPLIFGGAEFNESVLAHNLPFITRTLMTIAMGGLLVSVSLSFFLLPERPAKYSRKRYIYMFLQWFLVPIIAPLLGAMPAIDSQTRILIKKYFTEFWVTEKIVKK